LSETIEILPDRAEQVHEVPPDVDLVLVMREKLLGVVRIELDLEAAALGVALAEAGHDEPPVLLDEIAADVDQDGIFGEILDDGFLEIVEQGLIPGDELGDALVRGRVEDRVVRREQVQDRTAAELEVEVLEDALVQVVKKDRLEGRQAGRIQFA
jgi:hypothetical protein